MKNTNYAKSLTELFELQKEPVALSFCTEKPDDIKSFDNDSPSSCSFWELAENETFFAAADKHFNCAVGATVMGFDLPLNVKEELNSLVQKMCNSGYLNVDEVDKLPLINSSKAGVVYGPLKDFPLEPDVILLWLSPSQAMVFSEALGSCHWTNKGNYLALGRPGCAIIPTVLNEDTSSLSFGCIGMRTFTGVEQQYLLGGIAYNNAESFIKALKMAVYANKEMYAFYQQHKDSILN